MFEIPTGVGIGCQPLSAIMEEKLNSTFSTTGIISMKGDLKSSEGKDNVKLSASIEQFKEGKITCIIGHPESWVTPTAGEILDSLQQNGKILFTFLDEAHIPLSGHWDAFRPQMKLVSGMLRGRAVRGDPCLATTATLTSGEITGLHRCMGLREENTVVLQANPIQRHHKFVRYVLVIEDRS